MTGTDQIIVPAAPAEEAPEGMVQMVLEVEGARVLQFFEKPMQRILYEPANALEVAERLADLAYQLKGTLNPVGGALKHDIVERHRKTCTKRVANVLKQTRRDAAKNDEQLAQRIVEVVLNEIF